MKKAQLPVNAELSLDADALESTANLDLLKPGKPDTGSCVHVVAFGLVTCRVSSPLALNRRAALLCMKRGEV